jgi:hypothetical protein
MQWTSNRFCRLAALLALQLLLAEAPLAGPRQDGEDRWVPSFSITSGVLVQTFDGSVSSEFLEGTTPPAVPLRGSEKGDDLAVEAFVGGNLELMTPALDVPLRPRLFLSAEILPTFGTSRTVAGEGDPGCVRGPDINAVCAVDEDGSRIRSFGEDGINGEGSSTKAEIDTLVFGASVGAAFPFELLGRQIRVKPSLGWINYKVKAKGLVVDAMCPTDNCTDVFRPTPGDPNNVIPGVLRETRLEGQDNKRLNALGPGMDVEMDVGRFGQVGTALFAGARLYRVLGGRKIRFGAEETYDDDVGNDTARARFGVKVNEWMYRGHLGIRFQWLGKPPPAGDE